MKWTYKYLIPIFFVLITTIIILGFIFKINEYETSYITKLNSNAYELNISNKAYNYLSLRNSKKFKFQLNNIEYQSNIIEKINLNTSYLLYLEIISIENIPIIKMISYKVGEINYWNKAFKK